MPTVYDEERRDIEGTVEDRFGQVCIAKIVQEIAVRSWCVSLSYPPPLEPMIHACGKLTLFHQVVFLNPHFPSDALLVTNPEVHIMPRPHPHHLQYAIPYTFKR